MRMSEYIDDSVRNISICPYAIRRVRRPSSTRISGQASAGCGGDWTAYGSQPIVAVGFVAAGQGKKFVL